MKKPLAESAYRDEVYKRHLLDARRWVEGDKPFHVCIFRPEGNYAGRTAGFATIDAAIASARKRVDNGTLKAIK